MSTKSCVDSTKIFYLPQSSVRSDSVTKCAYASHVATNISQNKTDRCLLAPFRFSQNSLSFFTQLLQSLVLLVQAQKLNSMLLEREEKMNHDIDTSM